MAEAASRSYASVFCIERKPNAGSFVLKNNCGAWAESLATRQLWQAEQKGSAQGEERAFSSGLSALPARERSQIAIHQRTLTSAPIASLLG
jgi:hypothetical protein